MAHPGGRPSKYKPEFAEQARKLCELGATDIEMADFFAIEPRTLYRWRYMYPEFCQSLNVGKEKSDARVVRSLYQRAIGYEQEAVKIFLPAGAKEPVYAKYREQIAPDTTAAIFWLKNRSSSDWRDRIIQELTGKDGAPIATDNTHHGTIAISDTASFIADSLRQRAAPASEEPGSD